MVKVIIGANNAVKRRLDWQNMEPTLKNKTILYRLK